MIWIDFELIEIWLLLMVAMATAEEGASIVTGWRQSAEERRQV